MGAGTRGRLDGCDISGKQSAGVEVGNGAAPLITDCCIHHGRSGGVFVWGAGTRGRLESCHVIANNAAGKRNSTCMFKIEIELIRIALTEIIGQCPHSHFSN